MPCYERRTARVDEVILGEVYLDGAKTGRVEGARCRCCGGRFPKMRRFWLVGCLEEELERWQARDLTEDDVHRLFWDGWFSKVPIGRRRIRARYW